MGENPGGNPQPLAFSYDEVQVRGRFSQLVDYKIPLQNRGCCLFKVGMSRQMMERIRHVRFLEVLQGIACMLKNRKRRKSSLLRRKQIIETLRKLILRYGSEHVSVRRIAKEVGISQGAIYKHFNSKREILSFLVDYIEESLISDIQHWKPGNNVLRQLEKVVRNHLSSLEQRRGISFLVIAEIISLGDKKLNRKILGVLTQYISRIKELLEKGAQTGEIGQDINLDMAATMFFGMVQGLVTIWALSDHSFSVEQRYASLWDVLCKGIQKH